MSEPLVSVVIPTYNHAGFLKDAVGSVLDQTHQNIEVIVVDNHSQDNTEEIINSFSDPRIHYFKFHNEGIIARSRNLGIQKARGAYIAFLDSDDIWGSEKLKAQVDYLEKNPEVSLTFGYFKALSTDEKLNNKILGPKTKDVKGFIYNRLINFDFIITSSVMVRSDILKKVGGFDEDRAMRFVEDFDLWLRIGREHRMDLIPQVMGVYRVHATNSSDNEQRLNRALAVIDKHFQQGWISQTVVDRVYAHFYFREGWTLVDQDIKTARAFFRQAIHKGRKNIKILSISLLGMTLSLFPFLCRSIKNKAFDRKIGAKILAS